MNTLPSPTVLESRVKVYFLRPMTLAYEWGKSLLDYKIFLEMYVMLVCCLLPCYPFFMDMIAVMKLVDHYWKCCKNDPSPGSG